MKTISKQNLKHERLNLVIKDHVKTIKEIETQVWDLRSAIQGFKTIVLKL